MALDSVERTGPIVRVGVVTESSDEEAVVEFAQQELGTDQWPTDAFHDSERGWTVSFEEAYL